MASIIYGANGAFKKDGKGKRPRSRVFRDQNSKIVGANGAVYKTKPVKRPKTVVENQVPEVTPVQIPTTPVENEAKTTPVVEEVWYDLPKEPRPEIKTDISWKKRRKVEKAEE